VTIAEELARISANLVAWNIPEYLIREKKVCGKLTRIVFTDGSRGHLYKGSARLYVKK
jgi:hypothetical protein